MKLKEMKNAQLIRESLEREINIANIAIARLKKRVRTLEKKHKMTTNEFVREFEEKELGDREEYFEWFSFHKALNKWIEIKKALLEASS